MKRIAIASLLFWNACSAANAQDAQAPAAGPNGWSQRLYSFPAQDLIQMVESGEHGSAENFAIPAASAGAEAMQGWVLRSHDLISEYLKSCDIVLPQGSLVVFDPKSMTLAARTTSFGHELLAEFCGDLRCDRAKGFRYTLKVIEAPAKDVRAAMNDAQKQADHTVALARLEALIEKKEAQFAGFMTGETRSGQRSRITSGQEYASAAGGIKVDDKGSAQPESTGLTFGTAFEVDPVIGEDGKTIDLNICVEHQFAPQRQRNGEQQIAAQMIENPRAKAITALTLETGMSKLVNVWNVDRPGGSGKMQAAFVTGNLAYDLPNLDARVGEILRSHGEAIEPMPLAAAGPPMRRIPEGMAKRRYVVPPTVFGGGGAGGGEADPFAPVEQEIAEEAEKPKPRPNAREILITMGATFGEGSSATVHPRSNILTVINTPQQLDFIEQLWEGTGWRLPATMAFSFYVVEADGARILKLAADAAGIGDHTELWKQMEEASEQGKARMIDAAWIETRSGQRAKSEAGIEVQRPAGARPKPNQNAGKPEEGGAVTEAKITPLNIGLSCEIDPVLAEDYRTMEVNFALEYDFAPPTAPTDPPPQIADTLRINTPRIEYHKARITSAITIVDGTCRLAGVWKPVLPKGTAEENAGSDDTLQAVFIRANVLPIEPAKR